MNSKRRSSSSGGGGWSCKSKSRSRGGRIGRAWSKWELWTGLGLALVMVMLVSVTEGKAPSKPTPKEPTSKELPESALMVIDNKYRNASPLRLEEMIFGIDVTDATPDTGCHYALTISWIAEIGAHAWATPLLDDIFGDGERQIVLTTLQNFVEVLYGSDGDKAKRWPFAIPGPHASMVSSPLLFYLYKNCIY